MAAMVITQRHESNGDGGVRKGGFSSFFWVVGVRMLFFLRAM